QPPTPADREQPGRFLHLERESLPALGRLASEHEAVEPVDQTGSRETAETIGRRDLVAYLAGNLVGRPQGRTVEQEREDRAVDLIVALGGRGGTLVVHGS
ncbi:MAG: hypothetical protein WD993_02540, partial [Thermoleophilaceae bacterium]